MNDVATLLAANHKSTKLHSVKHIAVAHSSCHNIDALLLHGLMEAQIRHHSHDNGVVGQSVLVATINSRQSNQSIAIDYSSIFINCNQAIAVPVKCKTNINRNTSASTADEFTQRLWRCRTACIVDVTTIGCITH